MQLKDLNIQHLPSQHWAIALLAFNSKWTFLLFPMYTGTGNVLNGYSSHCNTRLFGGFWELQVCVSGVARTWTSPKMFRWDCAKNEFWCRHAFQSHKRKVQRHEDIQILQLWYTRLLTDMRLDRFTFYKWINETICTTKIEKSNKQVERRYHNKLVILPCDISIFLF